MELITILSTIILIATISTFILSIGAYILFKIRSRKEQRTMLTPTAPSKAELVTVPDVDNYEGLRQQAGKTHTSRLYQDEVERELVNTEKKIVNSTIRPKHESNLAPKYVKYSSERFSNSDKDRSAGDLQWK